jgi:hypothetical protein
MLALRTTGYRGGGGLKSQPNQQIAYAPTKVQDKPAGLCIQQCVHRYERQDAYACQPRICLPAMQTPKCRGFPFQMPLPASTPLLLGRPSNRGVDAMKQCKLVQKLLARVSSHDYLVAFSAHCVTRRSGRSFVCMPSNMTCTHVQ